MKYLLLLLFTFSAHAQFKLEITMSDSKYAKREIIQETKEKLIKRFINIEKKFNIAKGEWKESPESEIPKTITNLDETETTLYYHPINFSYTITDITQEMADKEAERLERATEREQVKKFNQLLENADTNAKWKALIERAMKKVIKECL